MKTLVMKFGGASVATAAHFSRVAGLILARKKNYPQVVAVVSAMSGMTDHLLQLSKEVHPNPPRRESDMLISVGERISIALLAMALDLKGQEAMSFTGSQAGIITSSDHSEALIIDVRPMRLIQCLESGKVAILAGFQGVSREKEITTLGRGGSDTSAVALAVALKAEKVEFYKDVPGIFDKDPKKDAKATFFSKMDYSQAYELVSKGAKILHPRAIALAEKNGLPLHVLSFIEHGEGFEGGTWIGEQKREECASQYEEALLVRT